MDIYLLIEKYIGEGVYKVPAKNNKKHIETTLPPEKRTLENIPKYSDGSSKVRFQDWLELERSPKLWPKLNDVSWGWGKNSRCYGWSHRGIGEFKVGDKVRRDTIGNDHDKEYTLETYKQVEEIAKKYAREVA